MGFVFWFLFWFLLSFLIAGWAQRWSRSVGGYFVISLIFSPLIAAIILLASGRNEESAEKEAIKSGNNKKCPYCAELIKAQAIVCRYCGKDLTSGSIHPDEMENARTEALAAGLSAAAGAGVSQSSGRSK